MNKLAAVLLCLLVLGLTARAQDITSLEKIGPLVGYSKNANSITLNCADKSQVVLSVLAPDLIRVRASFTKPIPARDHSWAIAKDIWPAASWSLKETADSITIATAEVEVIRENLITWIETNPSTFLSLRTPLQKIEGRRS